jgi:hypothetical protein
MMRAVFAVVLASVLSGAGFGSAGASAPAAPVLQVGGLSVVPWQPAESFPGGAQFDARLDAPAKFWGAGRPLRDVFTELTRQTGVQLGFADPQKDEPRLCVTLYLNPEKPPSLREVMAQLSWVTGCTFGFAQSETGEKSYSLLWSSVGQGTEAALAAQAVEQQEAFRTQRQTQRDAQAQSAAALLDEAKGALALSPQAAAARYRGSNDALLLNLLDPARRAALGFLTSLSDADREELLGGGRQGFSRDWSALSADQQAALTQALGLEGKLPAQGTVSVQADVGRGGGLTVSVGEGRDRTVLGRMRGLFSAGDLRGNQQVALQRLLGEVQTPEQEEAARSQQRAAWQAQAAERRQQQTQQREQAQEAARTLSSGCESQLASLTIPAASAGTLWQLQEAVAKASGQNVVSDCFWPPRGFGRGFGRRGQDEASPANALEALSAACAGGGGGFGGRAGGRFGGGGGPVGDLGMRWGDAGSFLRFRSQRPDIWRAAVLPEEVRTQLDAWLQPFLASASDSAGPGNAPLAGDVEKMSWLVGHLSDLQIRLGGAMPYEDPSDPQAARLQALRRATLQRVGMSLPALRLTATFTPEQWRQVKAEGLRWGYDLTPDQQAADVFQSLERAVPEERRREVVVQLGQSEERTFTQRDGTQRTVPPVPELQLLLDGTVVDQVFLGLPWGGPGGRGPMGPGGGRGGPGGRRGGGG